MCGISGIVSFRKAVANGQLPLMTGELVHRGPDDSGEYYAPDRKAALGFRRLSIIDLSTGHQPLSNEDGTVWITFNGEIYDFQNLRERLLRNGHKFSTKTDTEVIVHLYEELGEACVSELRGMFSFAIWDERNQRLFAARDRVGKKPFFYMVRDGRLFFASELKSLLAVAGELPDLDADALDQYLAFGYIPAPRTIYRDVYKLEPGHWLSYSATGLKTHSYWSLDFHPDPACDEATLLKETEELLRESVRLRLVSDVPLGAMLSGGVDSSIVVALMAQESAKPPKTFSVGFEESDFSELIHARKVATFLGTDHYEQIVNPEIIPEITELVHHYDEPFADSSMLPTYLVCKHARQHVTVALSGDGGDEILGGYSRYRYETMSDQILKVPGVRMFANTLSAFYPRHWRGYVPLVKMRYAGGARYAEQLSIFHTKIRTALYKDMDAASSQGAEEFIERNYRGSWNDCTEPLSSMQRVDILKGWLPGDMLTKVDMASMRTSLEVRCPLLDQRLIEYMARVPARFKIRGNVTKYLLKKIGERLVPPDVLYRPKQGFSLPLKHWFRQNLKEYVESNLVGPESIVGSVFRREAIQQVLHDHVHRGVDNSERIFSLLALEIWLRGKVSNPKHAVEWIRHSQVVISEKQMAVHGR